MINLVEKAFIQANRKHKQEWYERAQSEIARTDEIYEFNKRLSLDSKGLVNTSEQDEE